MPKTDKTELTREDILEAIKNMTVLEVSELVKDLEETFGVSAAAPVAVATMAAPATSEADTPAEEQTEFTVMLNEIGDNKINVIKAVRELTTLGLREAKELVEGAPAKVKEGVSREDAEAAKSKLDNAGAVATIQ